MQILWSGLLQFYGIISINLDSSRSQIGVHELTKFEEPDIEDLNNVLGSSWRGYIWKKEPDSVNIKDLNDVFTFTENRLKLTVARLENTGNRYLAISIKMFKKGEASVNSNITMIY